MTTHSKGSQKPQTTILYIEDDALNRRLVKRILEPQGYAVVTAIDGLSGIEMARKLRPALILMDINLPDIDGLGATVKIRSLPEIAKTPIVAVTAGGIDRARDRSLSMGCTGFISKPLDITTFPLQIKRFLEGYREDVKSTVGKDTATLFIRQESLSLITRLEGKIRELTRAKTDLEEANQALAAAFDEIRIAHESETRLHKTRADFIAVSSHELRTPLAVLTGYLDLLVGGHIGEISPEISRILKVAQRNAMRLSTIVTTLCDVARLETAGIDLHRDEIYVEDLIESLLSDLTPALTLREILAKTEFSGSRRPILADKARIETLLQGLLINAIRYTPDGGSITLETKSDEKGIEVRVQDTGIGIAKENIGRVFEPFYRVQDSLHHSSGTFEFQSGGIGLGLSLARGIVLEHGGTIRVESKGVDQGSVFIVKLPAHPPDPAAKEAD